MNSARSWLYLPIVVIASWMLLILNAAAEKFPEQCDFPKAAAGKIRKVDRQCGLGGKTDGPAADRKREQNKEKNNFCAQGPVTNLSREHFERLQSAVEHTNIEFGARERLPEDRSLLRQILQMPGGSRVGEGSLVRHVGFLSHPRYSNVENGESVNCNIPEEENNDLHFDLVQDTDDEACFSVTGEITPHRRAPHYEVPVLRHHRISERPVRVTGHLFFDASHKPCKDGEPRENLKRISLWEIHPVYSIDVCRRKTIEQCGVNNENMWVPIERFINVSEEEDDEN